MTMWRRASVFAACSTLAVTALAMAPLGASAAPELRPVGPAMVRIDGDVAVAKDLGNGRYRLVMPAGVTPTWIGPAEGIDGVSVGSFTPKKMVGSWALLGHKVDVGISSTLTWVERGKQRFLTVRITQPRMNGDDRLTFIARSPEALPREMKDFSVNIEGIPPKKPTAGPATRDTLAQTGSVYSIPGSTVTMQAFEYIANFGYAQMWIYGDCGSGNTSTDPMGWMRVNGTYQYTVSFTGLVCDGLKFWDSDGTTTSVVSSSHSQMIVTSSRTSGQASATFYLKGSNGAITPYSRQLLTWPG